MHAWRPYLAILILLALPLTAAADCRSTYVVESDGGKAWLGMNAGGFIAGEGQSFHLDCAGQITLVRCEIILDGLTWYGVPPLASGDVIHCDVMLTSGVSMATTSVTLDWDEGTRSVAFDFSGASLDLMAGDYMLAWYPAQPKQARMGYHQADDCYSEGVRYISSNGSAGPWTAASPENGDLAFRVNVDGFVPTDVNSWGQVKSLYR